MSKKPHDAAPAKPEKKATPPPDNPKRRFEEWESLEQDSDAAEQALRRLDALKEDKKKNP